MNKLSMLIQANTLKLPVVVGRNACSHTGYSSHNFLQSGHSPNVGNTLNTPVDCTAGSFVCILSWTAMICCLTVAADS